MSKKQHLFSKQDYLDMQLKWNLAGKPQRQRMLEQANQNKNNHYPRAFGFLPSWVREALILENKESAAVSNPAGNVHHLNQKTAA
ncbi:MAG: hypothetical protein ACSHWN_04565 [Methylophilaceae bacterium]